MTEQLKPVEAKALKALSLVAWEYAAQIHRVSLETLKDLERRGHIARFNEGFIDDTLRYCITDRGRKVLAEHKPQKRTIDKRLRQIPSRIGKPKGRF